MALGFKQMLLLKILAKQGIIAEVRTTKSADRIRGGGNERGYFISR
jgi:hypothetical protein